jgi:zinc transporter ZupT
MGDVAILMTNSFNPTQTVLCNGVINLISLVGVVIGLRITELDDVAKNYVLVFVAGNFIFIAADIWRNLFKNKNIWKNLIELMGIFIGVGLMFLILELEGHEHGHSHGNQHGLGHN